MPIFYTNRVHRHALLHLWKRANPPTEKLYRENAMCTQTNVHRKYTLHIRLPLESASSMTSLFLASVRFATRHTVPLFRCMWKFQYFCVRRKEMGENACGKFQLHFIACLHVCAFLESRRACKIFAEYEREYALLGIVRCGC